MVPQAFLDLWQQADAVIQTCAISLLVMSILSWTVILWRTWATAVFRRRHLQAPDTLPESICRALNARNTSGEIRSLELQTAVDEESLRLGAGLVIPAIVGATAPFIGLLGTVWGIYGTMIRLGSETRMLTIADVAGPVGETLVMTALGLATAIPAVIGYNLLEKVRRQITAELAILVNRAIITQASRQNKAKP